MCGMLGIYNLIHNLDQCCPIDLSVMTEMFYICAFQNGRQESYGYGAIEMWLM